MSKGGSTDVKETTYEKAQAQVAKQQWDLYSNDLSKYSDLFMNDVEDQNSAQKYNEAAADTNLAYQQKYGQARDQAATQLASAGVDPSSGKFKGSLDSLTNDQISGTINTTNKAQNSQADKYVAGLSDINSIGAGEKADSLAGFGSIADSANQKAASDAETSLGNSLGLQHLVGSAAGVGAGIAANNFKLGSATPSPQSNNGTTGVLGSSNGGLGLSTNFRDY
jgi:hypothetical protein